MHIEAFVGLGAAFGRPILALIHQAEHQALIAVGLGVAAITRALVRQTIASPQAAGWSGPLRRRIAHRPGLRNGVRCPPPPTLTLSRRLGSSCARRDGVRRSLLAAACLALSWPLIPFLLLTGNLVAITPNDSRRRARPSTPGTTRGGN
ncbi:MAG: hypothetical protein ABI401_11790 [Candidatus Dormibacter sp.]